MNMTKQISGISAAWMEKDGMGSLSVTGRTVSFRRNDGLAVQWHCGTPKEAEQQVRLFRASTKYPATRDAA
jgi:hypothetical protein